MFIPKIRQSVRNYFNNFYYYFSYIKYRIVLLILLSLIVGILDGFGLALFLPLLEMVSNQSGVSSGEQLGELSFLINFINILGFKMTLETILISMFSFFVLKGCFFFMVSYLDVLYQQYFICKVRRTSILLLADFSYESFIQSDAGRIQNSMSGEVGRVVQSYRAYINVIKISATILVYSVLAFLANPEFAILVAIGGGLTNILFGKFYMKTKNLSYKLVVSSHGFQGLLIQQVAFFKYLKATGLIKYFSEKLIIKSDEVEESQKRMGIINSILQSIREPLLIGVVIAVILVQVNLFGGDLGLIVLSILFFYRALTNILQLQSYWNLFLAFSGSIENLKNFNNELIAGSDRQGGYKFKNLKKNIVFNQVEFSYQDVAILNNINLLINKNETVAFVGESGSGKTTMMNLLSGLVKPKSGNIKIDGINMQDIDIITYNQKIGYITQEPVIFDDTIFNNVTFWSEKTEYNFGRFTKAIMKANIFEFVVELKDKEDSRLGNNGINLSGGQKQRISIARELYKEIDILIMDEATSSLDSETEKSIQQNIDLLKGRYTILIVAHRLSTIKNADRIFVMKKGRVIQEGTYNYLVNQGSDFKKMVELQEL